MNYVKNSILITKLSFASFWLQNSDLKAPSLTHDHYLQQRSNQKARARASKQNKKCVKALTGDGDDKDRTDDEVVAIPQWCHHHCHIGDDGDSMSLGWVAFPASIW